MPDFSKRYWLFEYNEYRPSGGLDDVKATFDTVDECFVEYAIDEYTEVSLWDNNEFRFVARAIKVAREGDTEGKFAPINEWELL